MMIIGSQIEYIWVRQNSQLEFPLTYADFADA
jgi:hypothetical protein